MSMGGKSKFLTAAAAVVLVLSAPLAADPVQNPVKWSQWVDLDNGHDIPSYFEYHEGEPTTWTTSAAADDWRCLDGLPVTDFHWWGSYLEGEPGSLEGFWIAIHDDIPADELHPSRPGAVVWEDEISFGEHELYEVPFGLNQTTEVYQYNYYLTDPQHYFGQEEGKIYWLSIVAHWDNPDNDVAWGWHTALRPAPENGLDAAVVMGNYNLLTNEYDLWGSLYDEGCNIQLAFELTTIPEPGSLAIVGTVALTLVGLLRRRRLDGPA